MKKPLAGKKILIVEDERDFRSLLESYLKTHGAQVSTASDGNNAMALINKCPDLLICDIKTPRINGTDFITYLKNHNNTTPIIVVSDTKKISDIDRVLRQGVQDVLFKPMKNFDQLQKAILACLYPGMFISDVEENANLFQDWDNLIQDPAAATRLLKQLQPPVQQEMANCRINYRQLTLPDQAGLILDIAPLSEHEIGFYCLDITQSGDNGILAALLMRTLFNNLLQAQRRDKTDIPPKLAQLIRQINRLMRQANLRGIFPLFIGHYQQHLQHVALISAGLTVNVHVDEKIILLNTCAPLGAPETEYFHQINQYCQSWECEISGKGGKLNLMLSSENQN